MTAVQQIGNALTGSDLIMKWVVLEHAALDECATVTRIELAVAKEWLSESLGILVDHPA